MGLKGWVGKSIEKNRGVETPVLSSSSLEYADGGGYARGTCVSTGRKIPEAGGANR